MFPIRCYRQFSVPSSKDSGATDELERGRGAHRGRSQPPPWEVLEARQLLAHPRILQSREDSAMSAATRSRIFGSPHRAARPRLEPLEPRLPLAATAGLGEALGGAATRVAIANHTLMVEGTAGPDRISIVPTRLPGSVRVVFDGKVLGSYGPVAAIEVDAGTGSDTVTVDPRITLPATLDGGAGNDRLQAGFAPTVLSGGAGNNVLIGAPGRDVFDVGSGQDRRVFLKSLGVIQVGQSLSGAVLQILSRTYTLRPLQVAGPVIVGAADLRDEAIVDLLRSNYNGGQTVALANATEKAATTLASMLGYSGPVDFPDGVRRSELIAFRQSDQGGRTVFSTSILPPTAHVPVARADRKEGRQQDAQGVSSYLQRIFSATPAVPAQPNLGGPAQDLMAIANADVQTQLYHDDSGAELQLTNTIYSVRSFTNKVDYYYVLQEIISKAGTGSMAWVASLNGPGVQNPQGPHAVILQPSPQSNPQTTSYTSDVAWSISGSIGFSAADGFNASISGGVAVSNAVNVQVPPIAIQVRSDPALGFTQWNYTFANPAAPTESDSFTQQWIWQVPWTYYQFDTFNNSFNLDSSVFYGTPDDFNTPKGTDFSFTVPVPFGQVLELAPPQVSVMNPKSVKVGATFIINGVNFYPSLVESVLIGGKPLDPNNFMAISNQQIVVVAPNTPGQSLPVVVKTTQGFSNANVPITITA
jgi:IPT/TIG domain/RTX calcium-binding nonapeptide repeat (4 copies)